jgi:SOS response regulatory protein OraA/RecX
MFAELLKEYSQEEILEGCMHIIAAEVSSEPELRAYLKKQIYGWSRIVSKKK